MKHTFYLCIATLICTIALSGCGPKPTSQELLKTTMLSAEEFMSSGMTDEAVTVLSEALENDQIDDRGHAAIFGAIIQIKLSADEDEEAGNLYMEAVQASDSAKVTANYGRIISYYLHRKDSDSLLEWTTLLMNSPLPRDLSVRTAGTHASALYDSGQLNQLLSFVPTVVQKYQKEARTILMPVVSACLRGKERDAGGAILDAIESNVGSDAALRSMTDSLRCHYLAMQGKIDEASKHFQSTVGSMSEQDASYALSRIAKASMYRPNLAEARDNLYKFILSSQKNKSKLSQTAARLWIESARTGNNLGAIPERLNALIDYQVPPSAIYNAYHQSFYAVLQSPDKKTQGDMLALCDTLTALLKDHPNAARCKALKLDGAFMMENFDLALQIIDSGIPDKDPEWLKMAGTKLRAHKALKEGRNKDAIGHFREFMEIIKGGEQQERDPSSGLLHTTDMTLGFNELRIAEILLADNDPKGAQACCKAAIAHYEKALSELSERKDEVAFIKGQIKQIKQLQKKAQSPAKTTAP